MGQYIQLQAEERKLIFTQRQAGKSNRAIANMINRHHSTIYHEVSRNTLDPGLGYLPDTATQAAQERQKIGLKIDRYAEIKNYVISKLEQGWPPQIIAGRMRKERHSVTISTEAIYQFIYSEEGQQRKLYQYLPSAQPKRG